MEIINIKTNEIVKGYNPRKNFIIEKLKISIKKKGVLTPLLIRKKDSKYEIVSGERRWRACNELKIKTIPCIIKELTDEEACNIAYIDNEDRDNFSVMEKAKHFSHMRAYYGYSSAQKLADKYGISRQDVDRYFQISELPETLPNVGQLTKIHLYSISKLVDKSKLIKVFEEGFQLKQEDWEDKQRKEFEQELKARQQSQIELANQIIAVEEDIWTVKRTEQRVKELLSQFFQRDEYIKKKAKEKLYHAINSLKEGVDKITNRTIELNKGFEDFSNVITFFTEDLFKIIPEEEKEKIINELDDMNEEVSKLEIKEVQKDIKYFKDKIK